MESFFCDETAELRGIKNETVPNAEDIIKAVADFAFLNFEIQSIDLNDFISLASSGREKQEYSFQF